ncbi:MAG: hypothetical protein LEGION0403_FIIPPAGN_02788 [Legionella sp.]|uniref:hypothetical protein n=1 Tax=Legionella sp. TaxID=459 RepID=UPI003D0CEE9B
MTRIIHPLAGMIAMLTISIFWLSTIIAELFGTHNTIALVKTMIPWGFFVLIPALITVGGSGISLAKGRRSGVIGKKLKRMPFIAANGILVLIPSALFLASKASSGEFDTSFYIVQAIELIAGATNLILLGLNIRDGLKLTQGKGKKSLSSSHSR